MQMSTSIAKLADALCKAQSELEGAKKDMKNSHLGNKYADLGSVWDACREVLPKHGLSVSQFGSVLADGRLALTTMLMHTSGEWQSGEMPIVLADTKMNPMQAIGSGWTYARRYGLAAAVGVIAEDDDGHGAGAGGKKAAKGNAGPTEDQYHNQEPPPPDPRLQAIADKMYLAKTLDELQAIFTKLTKEDRMALADVKDECKGLIAADMKAAKNGATV